jgi:hypothetical protein
MAKRKKLPPRDRLGRFAPASKKPGKKRKVRPSKRTVSPVKRPSLRTVLTTAKKQSSKRQRGSKGNRVRTVLRDIRGRFVSAKKTVTQKLREENKLLRKRIKDLRELREISEGYEIIQSVLKEEGFTPSEWKRLTKRQSSRSLEKTLRALRTELGLTRMKKNERWMFIDQNYFRNRHGIKELAAETGMSESAIWTILMSG